MGATATLTPSNMVQINNTTQEALLGQEDAPVYDTTGSWYAWMTGSKASLACKDRPLVWAVQRNTSLVGYEARDTVAAALKGDVIAQRKLQAALDNGNTADSSSSGWCSCWPRANSHSSRLPVLSSVRR